MAYPRRSYFPNPRLQLQMIAAANVLALLSTVLMALLLLLTQMHLQGCASFLPLASGVGGLRGGIAAQERDLLLIGAGIAASQFVLFNLVAVIFSHRIAGPLYRLQKHLQAVAAGAEPVDVQFRKGDLYRELAFACNALMARLRNAPGR